MPDLETVLEYPTKCDSSIMDEQYLDVPEATAAINKSLSEIGETPLSKGVSHNPKRVEDKIEKITDVMKGLFMDSATASNTQNDESEIILQLKEKFQATKKRSDNYKFSLFYHKIGPGNGYRVSSVCLTAWYESVFSPVLIQSLVPHFI